MAHNAVELAALEEAVRALQAERPTPTPRHHPVPPSAASSPRHPGAATPRQQPSPVPVVSSGDDGGYYPPLQCCIDHPQTASEADALETPHNQLAHHVHLLERGVGGFGSSSALSGEPALAASAVAVAELVAFRGAAVTPMISIHGRERHALGALQSAWGHRFTLHQEDTLEPTGGVARDSRFPTTAMSRQNTPWYTGAVEFTATGALDTAGMAAVLGFVFSLGTRTGGLLGGWEPGTDGLHVLGFLRHRLRRFLLRSFLLRCQRGLLDCWTAPRSLATRRKRQLQRVHRALRG